MRISRNAVLASLCASCAIGQVNLSYAAGPNGFHGSASFGSPDTELHPVIGAPYSAEQVASQVQTLSDGTHITTEQEPTLFYRDSLGRTRIERHLFTGIRTTASGQAPASPPSSSTSPTPSRKRSTR